MCSEKYNEKLIALINPILSKLSDERKRYLEEELNNENEKIKIKTCINAFPRYVESFRKELKKYIPDDSFLPMFLY